MSKAYNFNSELFDFVLAQDADRSDLTELAVNSNNIYQTRTAPINVAREIFSISPEQTKAGLVEKLVQKDSSKVLGFYALRTKAPDLEQKRIELQLLFVESEYIKSGFGTILCNRAIEKAKNMGMKVMCGSSDPDACSFYLRYGATITGTRENLLNPKVPVVLLDYDLSKFSA